MNNVELNINDINISQYINYCSSVKFKIGLAKAYINSNYRDDRVCYPVLHLRTVDIVKIDQIFKYFPIMEMLTKNIMNKQMKKNNKKIKYDEKYEYKIIKKI